jgi:hypothetical protein
MGYAMGPAQKMNVEYVVVTTPAVTATQLIATVSATATRLLTLVMFVMEMEPLVRQRLFVLMA